jgi:hypothetical protein
MKTHRTTLTLVMILAAAGAFPIFGEGVNGSRPTVTLRVRNEASVDSSTLLRAEKAATVILSRSGVDLILVDCQPGRADAMSVDLCQRERNSAEFWFRLVTRKPRATSDQMLGYTELDESSGDGSAGVSYPAAVELADKYGRDIYQILGAAIADEVGHLVLGANAHTHRGVMSPRWGRAEFELISIGQLSFTPDQSRRLQHELSSRAAASRREVKTNARADSAIRR